MAKQKRPSLLANLALVVLSAVVSLLLLGLVEVALRVAGVGDDRRTSQLKYQQIHFPTLVPGKWADGTRVLLPADPRLRYQSVLRDKPEGALRVVTFGGSATAGLGFSPNVTFSRELERALRSAYPGRKIEVLNLGIVALASKQVKLLVAEVAQLHEADVMIVYSGNNEFLEVHAEKYAESSATRFSRLGSLLMDLNLYRLVNGLIRGPQRGEALKEQEFSNEDLQLTQDAIIQQVSMTEAEISEVVDRYEANVEEMAEAAARSETPIVLVSVASNWEWRGRSDLPDGWLEELVGESATAAGQVVERAREILDEHIGNSPADERHEWLFKRALLHERAGDLSAATADYRAAMNTDPHLRRALDAANERLRAVALRRGTGFVDSVLVLSKRSPDGIVGFEDFYDYVHFTPRGNVWLAAALFDALEELGVTGPAAGFDSEAYAEARLAQLAGLQVDSLTVGDWMGFGFDAAVLGDRDLWKYDRMLQELDERIAADSGDVAARVYRGNGHYFRLGGGADAGRDYRSALELDPENQVIRANLERLEFEGREAGGS